MKSAASHTDPQYGEWALMGGPLPQLGNKIWGWVRVGILAALLPLSIPYFLLDSVLMALRVIYTSVRKSASRYGSDSAWNIDLVSGLIVVPLLGLFATVGTSLGFYLLSISDPGKRGAGNIGWSVIEFAVILPFALIVQFAIFTVGHKTGSGVLVFEPDAPPKAALKKIYSFQGGKISYVLPGRVRVGATYALIDIASKVSVPYKAPGFMQCLRGIWSSKIDRKQVSLVFFGGCAWCIVPLFLLNSGWHWWPFVSAVLAAFVFIVLSSILRVKSYYYDYLRWGMRANVMRQRLLSETALRAEKVLDSPENPPTSIKSSIAGILRKTANCIDGGAGRA